MYIPETPFRTILKRQDLLQPLAVAANPLHRAHKQPPSLTPYILYPQNSSSQNVSPKQPPHHTHSHLSHLHDAPTPTPQRDIDNNLSPIYPSTLLHPPLHPNPPLIPHSNLQRQAPPLHSTQNTQISYPGIHRNQSIVDCSPTFPAALSPAKKSAKKPPPSPLNTMYVTLLGAFFSFDLLANRAIGVAVMSFLAHGDGAWGWWSIMYLEMDCARGNM